MQNGYKNIMFLFQKLKFYKEGIFVIEFTESLVYSSGPQGNVFKGP